ncbi:putative spermine/spermidine acetyltransferase BltD, partial [Vibrio parahaemolyticus VP2007-007]
GSV